MGEKRALVVGRGRMGRIHERALTDLGCVVETVDPVACAHHKTIPLSEVQFGEWDVVCIATPIPTLAEEALRWVGFGGHLLIEKPMAATVEEARGLARLLSGQRVAVGYVERFNPVIRALAAQVGLRRGHGTWPSNARVSFTRWNDRPSPNVDLDLRSHDVDLSRFLRLPADLCEYDARDRSDSRVRTIDVSYGDGLTLTANLMAHDTSPVHAMWRAFLSGQEGCATPADAVAVLESLDLRNTQLVPCAA